MSDLRTILEGMHQQYGRVTPTIVVDEARPENHPLHDRFEWNDTIAGEKYRLVQAQQMIRSVKVIREDDHGNRQSVRRFVNVSRSTVDNEDDTTGTYIPIEVALTNPATRDALLEDFKRDWKLFRERYEHLAEFAEIIASDLGLRELAGV